MKAQQGTISKKWRDLFSLLPRGYDPIATAPDGWWFDAKEANRACSFFTDCIVHVEGKMAGQPYKLEPHEQALTGCLMGWKRPDGTRRYRECLYFVPRKNSKSTWSAGMVLMLLGTDGEWGAQGYSTAATRDQASLVYRIAKQMVLMKPELRSRFKIRETYKAIDYKKTGSHYKAISADAASAHGLNVHFAINDEIHAHRNGELLEVIETATGARTQPLIIHVTTSDFDREGSVCNAMVDRATQVVQGVLDDPSFLPALYYADTSDDWQSPDTWAKANPMLGKSVSLEYLERQCIKAKSTPSYENTFKRLHLNIRTENDIRWLPLADWDECKADRPKLAGERCYLGLDLSSVSDLTALVQWFPDHRYMVPHFFMPADNLEQRSRKEAPYETWQRGAFSEQPKATSLITSQ